ncbi:uncharacterized protein LOC113279154 [Papaver somniferum]|uniref:uncharacterized protein LOC113279154 n=1 Tax=Papaver somniferum TaxID=3469 RepID=UPI000E705FE1|nr:uncharacterized protein LOC113279154 [Papaver somniferum]
MWKLDISQRIKLFLWKCLQNALPANSKLFGKVKDVVPHCTMCGVEIETTEHLLFHCPYAKEVWNSSPYPISLTLDTSSKILDLCKDWLNNPRKEISIELILTKMWFTWKERCNRVFEDKAKTAISMAIEIQRHIYFWSKRSCKPKKTKQVQKKKASPIWKSPQKDSLKINVDAAWISETLPSGYALVMRNGVGPFEGGRAGQSAGSDPQEAEAIRVLQATVWAKEKNIKNFSIEGDCERLFNYFHRNNSDISWRAKACLDELNMIENLCTNFWGFYFVPRLGNMAADTLAKFIRTTNSALDLEITPPLYIMHQLSIDKSNIERPTQGSRLDGSTSIVMSTHFES